LYGRAWSRAALPQGELGKTLWIYEEFETVRHPRRAHSERAASAPAQGLADKKGASELSEKMDASRPGTPAKVAAADVLGVPADGAA
jgi:hypothetical protein